MKRITFVGTILWLTSTATFAQHMMKVEKTDGTTIEYPITDVKRIYFVDTTPIPEPTPSQCPDANHPHMIDLGLPSGTLWACCNVGVHAPEEYGDYFAWGETTPKTTYDLDTYKWWNGSDHTLTKYCTDSNWGTVDNKTTLEAADDAATANWGAPWRTPTKAQIQELLNTTTSGWTTVNNIRGYKFTGPNGGSVFLPAAGDRWGAVLASEGLGGLYWSSSLYESDLDDAYHLYFGSGDTYHLYNGHRYYGLSVRPVR